MSEGNNFQANVKIAFIGPVFIFTGITTILIVGTILAVLMITHWAQFVAWSGWIAIGFVLVIAAVTILLVALLVAHVYEKWAKARGVRMKNKVLHTDANYAIVEVKGQAHVVPVTVEKFNYNIRQVENPPETKLLEAPKPYLPTLVRYEDIKSQIPQDHALVGVSEQGIETRHRSIKSLVWVVGGSGTGKTNTVSLRVDEDYQWGHHFLGIDPHAFKEDSLTNAIKGYSSRFLIPIAQDVEDILGVLNAFLDEFQRRKQGGRWTFPVTMLIDEVGSLTADKPESKEEEEMIAKIKQVARICGQESRGFEMGGMFISQDAAGLAWLRKRALMVLAHQMLMMSERLLVCNQNTEIAKDMDTWPIGRTLVYGIGFKEGQRVLQQPLFTRPRIVEADRFYRPPMPDLPPRQGFPFPSRPFSNLDNGISNGRYREEAQEVRGRTVEEKLTDPDASTKKVLQDIGKRLRNGEKRPDILRSYGATSGRANQEIGAVIDMVAREEGL